MSDWDDHVAVALLGTERRAPPSQSLVSVSKSSSAEQRLLASAGALALYRHAGRVAPPAPELPVPAPPDTRPICPPAAVLRLELLFGERRELLAEWLRALERRGFRAPPEHLADLLEGATAGPELRDLVEAVLGERGSWLAAQQPRWAWAAPIPDGEDDRERMWATGERAPRQRLFTVLRRIDPGAARRRLEESWRQESSDDRLWFLSALGEGLSAGDEPLLERALRERRRDVRTAAAALLSRLPESAFARRMRERALALVRVERGLRKRLRIDLPDALDEAMAADGIGDQRAQGLGERAGWLAQIVGLTPLEAWDVSGVSPDQAANLRANDGLEQPFRLGLVQAAHVQRDPRWASALLDLAPALAAIAPAERAAEFALARLREGYLDAAVALPAPWPPGPSARGVALLVELIGADDVRRARLLADRLHPSVLPEASALLERQDPDDLEAGPRARMLIAFISKTLTLRHDMYQELE